MPLNKQAKALYEAALRRKGLQPGKAVRQDPRTFVGPIRMEEGRRPDPYHAVLERVFVPSETYWNHRGRLQDLETNCCLPIMLDCGNAEILSAINIIVIITMAIFLEDFSVEAL